jgi:hypothetical protein
VKSEPNSAAAPSRATDHVCGAAGSTAPVVILSYAHSGARLIQQALSDGTDLACTAGTGILPLCEAAAATWAQIDNRPGKTMSQLAISSIRVLASTQVATILAASAGKRRWCELAVSASSGAQTFLQIFPAARFVCVHRACAEVICAAIAAQPWGLVGPAMSPFTASYPGNSVAAAAAYWALATERLLAFEAANPEATSLVRYEDVISNAHRALGRVRSSLNLHQQAHQQPLPTLPERIELAAAGKDHGDLEVPVDMIPAELRKRVDHLLARLGYPPAMG